MNASAQNHATQGPARKNPSPLGTSTRVNRSKARASFLAATAAMLFVSACGGGSDPSGADDLGALDDNAPATIAEAEVSNDADISETSAQESGGMEIIGDDATCPFISTEAVIAATGIAEFAEADFGPNSNTQGEYICSWTTSFTGPAVHMLVRNGGGGWTAEIMDNPNMWGDGAGRDYLIESVGPMGDFLEVWSAEKRTSNYVYGDQIFNARGPYTIDGSLNPYAEYIVGWYGTNDPSESNDIARALLEATDETFIPQS